MLLIRNGDTESSSPTVATWSSRPSADSARALRPAWSSGVVVSTWTGAMGSAPTSSSGTCVMASAAANRADQACASSERSPNRCVESRASALRKNAVIPWATAGSNMSGVTVASSVMVAGSASPLPHTGLVPVAISKRVTAMENHSAARS